MVKPFWLVILFFSSCSIVVAQNDSLHYKVKFSLGYNYAFNWVNYNETTTTEFIQHSGSSYTNSSFQKIIKTQPIFFPELNVDFRSRKNFKFTLGFFVTKMNFSTPIIPSTVKIVTNHYSGYHVDSTSTFYAEGDKYQDNIRLTFFGNSLGMGYCFSKNRFMFDFDVDLKILWQAKCVVIRDYTYANPAWIGKSTGGDTLNIATTQGLRYISKASAYSLKSSLSYRLWKKLYCSLGLSYTQSFSSLNNNRGDDYFNSSNGYQWAYSNGAFSYKYSIGIRQFAIHTGIAFAF